MDLLPTPDQLVAASANLTRKVLRGGVADLRPMPSTVVDEGPLREVRHYRPLGAVTETGDPVLLVAPLSVPARCYDLRRGCSLAEHLLGHGRPTYLLDYGPVTLADPDLRIDHWVTDVLPEAVRRVAAHGGDRPVHLVGWGLGSVLALLAAARPAASLPIGSVALLAPPVDLDAVPRQAPERPFPGLPGVWRGTRLPLLSRLLDRPVAELANLDDREFLAQVEAVRSLVRSTSDHPGRSMGTLYHRLLGETGLSAGTIALAGSTVRLADVAVPVLALAGAEDTIAGEAAVRPLTALLTGAPEARVEVVPGGHLGMLTGRAARTATWPALEAFGRRHASGRSPAIGANPRRRYASHGSRTLVPAGVRRTP